MTQIKVLTKTINLVRIPADRGAADKSKWIKPCRAPLKGDAAEEVNEPHFVYTLGRRITSVVLSLRWRAIVTLMPWCYLQHGFFIFGE